MNTSEPEKEIDHVIRVPFWLVTLVAVIILLAAYEICRFLSGDKLF